MVRKRREVEKCIPEKRNEACKVWMIRKNGTE